MPITVSNCWTGPSVRKLNALLEGKKGRTSLSRTSHRPISQSWSLPGRATSYDEAKWHKKLAKPPSDRFCESLEGCPFFNEKMANMPSSANHYKEKYCMGDNSDCA